MTKLAFVGLDFEVYFNIFTSKAHFYVLCCLSYFSTAVTKYHGQGNLANIALLVGVMVSEG